MPGSRFVAFIISNQCGQVLAVGLMGIENLFRYPALAVGLKPSASQGEARLRGLYQIIYSKTISPRLSMAKSACASRERQRRPSRLSPLHSEARLRGLYQIIYSKTISPRLSMAKPACASRERQRRPSRLSPLASRLSPLHSEARLHGREARAGHPCELAGAGFLGKPLRAISRFQPSERQTPPSPLVGEGGWGDEGQRRTGMQKAGRASFQRARNIPERPGIDPARMHPFDQTLA
jgi:hypothetical protein